MNISAVISGVANMAFVSASSMATLTLGCSAVTSGTVTSSVRDQQRLCAHYVVKWMLT